MGWLIGKNGLLGSGVSPNPVCWLAGCTWRSGRCSDCGRRHPMSGYLYAVAGSACLLFVAVWAVRCG